MKLTFLGATQTVTGSKYLLEDGRSRVLIDCGLFQGTKELRQQNWDPLPFAPESLSAVLLTHAHIDHTGYVPLLVKRGFRGPVYASAGTRDLCGILLPDCGHLQEEDAEAANRYGFTKHHPALPLYTEDEAQAALDSLVPVPYGQPQAVPGTPFTFHLSRAGHIIGAAIITVTHEDGTRIVFSGDLGRLHNPVMKPPAQIQDADYLLIESTYGDRQHEADDPTEELGRIIRNTAARGGTVVIPSFAVGRAQAILYHLYLLLKDGRIPPLPIFLDSPMAIDATAMLKRHPGDHKLSDAECGAVCAVPRYVHTPEESKAINATNGMPKVIISASGMATGGRVLHHLKHYIGDIRSTVLFAGYQAAETRGEKLLRGDKTIKIHGQEWEVRAQIAQLNGLSAHADYVEILEWLRHFRQGPKRTFIVHGEPHAAQSLRDKIIERYGWEVEIPTYAQQVEM